MYANVSRSGTSSTSTPQQRSTAQFGQPQQFPQNLSLPGSAEMAEGGRPSTRRGGRPGSQSLSGGSAEGRGGTAETEGGEDHPNGTYERRGTVDVWTRDQSARMAKNGENHGNEDSPKSSTKSRENASGRRSIKSGKHLAGSPISSQASAENEGARRQSYPELSEPDHYSSEQFEESEGEEEVEEGGNGNGGEDEFLRKLREMASAAVRNRSLHESLQSAIQRGAAAENAGKAGKLPPSKLPPLNGNGPGTRSRKSSKGSGEGSLARGMGSGESTREGRESGNGRPIPRPRQSGSVGLKANEGEANGESSQGWSSSSAGSAGTRVLESSMKANSEAAAQLNGFPQQKEGVPNNVHHLPNNGHHSKSSTAQQIAAAASPAKGINGGGQRIKAQEEFPKQFASLGMAERRLTPNNLEPTILPQRLSVSRDGQRPQRSVASGFQEVGKVPLGFGSSSARNCLISASGRAARPAMAKSGEIQGEGEGEMRRRSASVLAIRGEENANYKGWLRQKLAEEKAKKEKEVEKREQEEKNKKEKKELAEKNFVRWKAEMDRKMAERKERERRQKEQKAKREREEKDEKHSNAQRTFVYWKKTRDERSRAQRERSRSAEQRKRGENERKKEEKRREAEAAFHAWIQEADDRKRAREERAEEEKAEKEREKEKQGEMRRQIADEAYGLWLHMKDEERKYKQSLAFRILDFERKSNAFVAPWIPTTPSTLPKLHRPPPELVQGRRRTLEKRLILPHSRSSHSANNSAKGARRIGSGQGGGRQAKSAVGSRRPWR